MAYITTGGLNDRIRSLLRLCEERNVAVVFALNRRSLGHALGTKRPTMAVGIQGTCVCVCVCVAV